MQPEGGLTFARSVIILIITTYHYFSTTIVLLSWSSLPMRHLIYRPPPPPTIQIPSTTTAFVGLACFIILIKYTSWMKPCESHVSTASRVEISVYAVQNASFCLCISSPTPALSYTKHSTSAHQLLSLIDKDHHLRDYIKCSSSNEPKRQQSHPALSIAPLSSDPQADKRSAR